jgi:hypothetical protein
MHEVFDQMQFVVAAYVIGVTVTLAMVAGSWASMRRAEKRRDRVREL